jgi:hypothetical protein
VAEYFIKMHPLHAESNLFLSKQLTKQGQNKNAQKISDVTLILKKIETLPENPYKNPDLL